MANLIDPGEAWDEGIYQIEQADPVLGGAPNPATGAGLVNIPHQQLARRTQWLKAQILAAVAALVPQTRTVSGGGLASGGGDLSANRTITVTAATEAEARARTDNAKAMTPLRTGQAVTTALADFRADTVGSVTLALNLSGELINTDGLVAGSSLRRASTTYSPELGGVPTGTWRAMSVTRAGEIGLFRRIA